MMGMEKMIAQMLGITPEKMGEMVTGFQDMLSNLNSRLSNIEAQNAEILAAMKGTEDGECRNIDGCGGQPIIGDSGFATAGTGTAGRG